MFCCSMTYCQYRVIQKKNDVIDIKKGKRKDLVYKWVPYLHYTIEEFRASRHLDLKT
jgi:hypothetical protein